MTAENLQNTVPPGTIVGDRYRVEHQLGRGGFARVYAASHLDLKRPVALKIIDLPTQAGAVDSFIARFLREAQIAANLTHPNVVTVYDYGVVEATGQPFLAMERLEGIDLEEFLRSHGALGVERSIALMLPVLDALDVAQSRGVVHKDLKPSNLFFVDIGTSRERLVVLDFGIARLYNDEESRLTQTGGYTGTPAYFAPEYADRQIVTPAIDVYQSALILVEMITGSRAVQARSSVEYMIKHCQGELDIPAELLGGDFGAVIGNALETDYTRRFADCGKFRTALAAIDSSTVASPAGYSEPSFPAPTPEHPHFTDEREDFGSGETLPHTPNTPFSLPSPTADAPGTKPPARRPLGWIATAGFITFGVVVGALAIAANRAPPEAPAKADAAEVEEVAEGAPPAKADPAPPAHVRPIILRTDPAGAEARIGGRSFGATPVELYPHEVDGDYVDVEFTRPGYRTLVRSLKLESGVILDVRLLPEAEEQAAAPEEPSPGPPATAKRRPKSADVAPSKRSKKVTPVETRDGTDDTDEPAPYSIVH